MTKIRSLTTSKLGPIVFVCFILTSSPADSSVHCDDVSNFKCKECDDDFVLSLDGSCVHPAQTISNCLVSKYYSVEKKYICAMCEDGFYPKDGVCKRRTSQPPHPQRIQDRPAVCGLIRSWITTNMILENVRSVNPG